MEEELKKARAYAAAERISVFATAFNQTGQMPVMPARPKMPNIMLQNVKEEKMKAVSGIFVI